jgi:hypothetical protein
MAAAWSVFHLVAGTRREAMALFDVASVGELQVRGNADLNLGQYVEQQRAPPLTWPSVHRVPQPVCCRRPPLRRSQHEIDSVWRGDRVAVIEHRLLDA